MVRWFPLCLAIFVSATAAARVEPDQFLAWMRASFDIANSTPAALRDRAKGYRYLYVTGFLGDLGGTADGEAARTLRAMGVPQSRMHLLRPSSLASIEDNAGYVRDFLRTTIARGPEPLVIVAHSKGAAETFAALAGAGPEIHRRIKAVFFLQGAFGGSPLADFFYGDGADIDERMPASLRTALQWIKNAKGSEKLAYAQRVLGITFDGGLGSLTKRKMEYLWERVFATSRPAIEAMEDKLYFIRSRETSDKVSSMYWPASVYMSTYIGDNDGVLATAGMFLANVGTEFVRLRADHTVLLGGEGDGQNRRLRRAFTEAIAATAASD